MSAWVGSTQYVRVQDAAATSGREVWVAQGFTLAQPEYCWKVKRDQTTGRSFFVNLAGLGKKWKLPDIYEPGNMPTRPPVAASGKPDARHALPSGYPHPPPPNHIPDDVLAAIVSSPPALPTQRSTPPPSGYDAIITATAAAHMTAPSDDLGGYGDAGEWDELSPFRQEKEEQRREVARAAARESEERRREVMEAEKAALDALIASVQPVRIDMFDHTETASPPRAQTVAESHLEATVLQQAYAVRAAATAAILSQEQQLQKEQIAIAAQTIRTLQVDHSREVQLMADTIRSGSERSPSLRSRNPSVVNPYANTFGSPTSPPHGAPPQHYVDYAVAGRAPGSPAGSVVPFGAAVAAASGSYDSPRTTDALISQMEHERSRIQRLEEQLEERDRVIAEFKLMEAERERREVAMRIRMLEAMAAFRARRQLVDDEVGSLERRRGVGGVIARHLPPHPLLDDVADMDD